MNKIKSMESNNTNNKCAKIQSIQMVVNQNIINNVLLVC